MRSRYGRPGRKYLSQRSSVMWSSFTHSTNRYGPVPIGNSFGSFSASAFSLTISVACDSIANSGPNGRLRLKRTWCAPTASTPSTGEKNTRIGSLFLASSSRLKVKATSLAVNGSPLWKVALSTRSKTHVFSPSCFHDFASPGTNWPASST